MPFKVLIHGGAGVISKDLDSAPYFEALQGILKKLFAFCQQPNIGAVDIVEYGVLLLEDDILFNAGLGSAYTCDKTHELDATIMDGASLACGSVAIVKDVKNPIRLARAVMEKTPHNFLAGADATSKFADTMGLEKVENSYYNTIYRAKQLEKAKQVNAIDLDHNIHLSQSSIVDKGLGSDINKGTVGCVCMCNGHVAAATSTGGMTNKMCGRIGDTAVIGAGTYASDATAALSGTGHGEEFIRHCAAHDVAARIAIGNCSLAEAMRQTVHTVLPIASGGFIGVNSQGESSFEFNCSGMFRGMVDSDGNSSVGIWEECHSFLITD